MPNISLHRKVMAVKMLLQSKLELVVYTSMGQTFLPSYIGKTRHSLPIRQFRFEKLDDEHCYQIVFHMVGQKKIMFGGKK